MYISECANLSDGTKLQMVPTVDEWQTFASLWRRKKSRYYDRHVKMGLTACNGWHNVDAVRSTWVQFKKQTFVQVAQTWLALHADTDASWSCTIMASKVIKWLAWQMNIACTDPISNSPAHEHNCNLTALQQYIELWQPYYQDCTKGSFLIT